MLPQGLFIRLIKINKQARPARPAKFVRSRVTRKSVASQFFIWGFEDHVLAKWIDVEIGIDLADGTIARCNADSI